MSTSLTTISVEMMEEMDAEIERLRGENESWKALVSQHEAEIERLRRALERTRPHVRNEIIEECARVAEICVHPLMDVTVAERYSYVAAAIRALKDKP